MSDRSREFWTPEQRFKGRTVFILAGGPSLRGFDASVLAGRSIIVVNSSYALAPFADVLYFSDAAWFIPRRRIVENWRGVAVTGSREVKGVLPDTVHRIKVEQRQDFPPPGHNAIRYGHSSGHIAISLAIAMGATRVVLLGYDMKVAEDGRTSHHHDEYRERDPSLYGRYFIPGFHGWRAAAAARGAQIVNATPGSALEEFERTTLQAELGA